jgi:HSP20 family protein
MQTRSNIFGRSILGLPSRGVVMVMGYADPFETLFAFQRALENRFSSDWLGATTASMGTYPPINVFQQDDNLVAIIELPGVDKGDLNIKQRTIPLGSPGKR